MVDLSTVSAVPGDWIGVRAERVLAVLPADASRAAARLWVALDEGAGFDQALDVLLRGGLSDLGAFALFGSEPGGRLRALVRGPVGVSVTREDGSSEQLDAGGLTWREERFDDAARVRVECGPSAEGPGEAFAPGLRRVGGLVLGAVDGSVGEPVLPPATESPAPAPAHVDERPAATPVVLVGHVDDAPEPDAEATPEPEPVGAVAPPAEFDDLETAPLVASPVPVPAPAATEVPEFPAEAETWQDDVTSHIAPVSDPVEVPGVPAPAAVVPAPAPAVPEADISGLATGITEVLGTRHAPAEPTRVEPAGRATFSHGLVVEVDRPYVVGRAPSLRPGQEDGRTVTVPSPLGEISATHVEIRPGTGADAGRVVVVDLGSTNGTLVLRAGQTPLELLPGVPFVLSGEAVVDLGDGATVKLRSR